jgi:hypothetical protein
MEPAGNRLAGRGSGAGTWKWKRFDLILFGMDVCGEYEIAPLARMYDLPFRVRSPIDEFEVSGSHRPVPLEDDGMAEI